MSESRSIIFISWSIISKISRNHRKQETGSFSNKKIFENIKNLQWKTFINQFPSKKHFICVNLIQILLWNFCVCVCLYIDEKVFLMTIFIKISRMFISLDFLKRRKIDFHPPSFILCNPKVYLFHACDNVVYVMLITLDFIKGKKVF